MKKWQSCAGDGGTQVKYGTSIQTINKGGWVVPVPCTTGPRAFSTVRTVKWSGSAQNGDTETCCGKNPQCSWLPAGSNKSFFLSGEKKRKKNGKINPCDPRHEHGTQNVRCFRNTVATLTKAHPFHLKTDIVLLGTQSPLEVWYLWNTTQPHVL